MRDRRSGRGARARAALRGGGRRGRRGDRRARARARRACCADDVARVLTRRPRRKLRPAWKWAPALAVGVGALVAAGDAHAVAAALRAVRHVRRPRRRVRDARQRHRHRAVLRRHVDRGRHAQRGPRARRAPAPARPSASSAGGRRSRSSTVRAPAGTSRSARSRSPSPAPSSTSTGRTIATGLRGGDEVGNGRRARLADRRGDSAARRPAPGRVAREQDAGRQRGRARRTAARRAGDRPTSSRRTTTPAPRRAASALVAQAAPELTLRDAPAPAESPETLARLRALSPPPFEPAPPPPPPRRRPPAPPAPAVSDLGLGGAGLQRAARCPRSGSSTPRKASASSPATPRRCSATRSSTTPSRGAAAGRCASTRRSTSPIVAPVRRGGDLPAPHRRPARQDRDRPFHGARADRRRVRGAHPGGPGRSAHGQQLQPAPDARHLVDDQHDLPRRADQLRQPARPTCTTSTGSS